MEDIQKKEKAQRQEEVHLSQNSVKNHGTTVLGETAGLYQLSHILPGQVSLKRSFQKEERNLRLSEELQFQIWVENLGTMEEGDQNTKSFVTSLTVKGVYFKYCEKHPIYLCIYIC